ncbi:MAG: glycosyl hydrolase [Armatimonadetes bacterium]|nr:glycosyl hydrolase [Armatimonadota bacterium]
MGRRFALVALTLFVPTAFAQTKPDEIVDGLKWRSIGPYRGGRSVACSGVVGRPTEFYMGACGGGLWKTGDAGQTWKCVSDGFFATSSVGAVTVSPSSPDVVYAGTGERDIRGNISEGDGVYKSTDGGKAWRNVGLKDTQTVARIVVHPSDPNIVWVAALGHIYGPNKERGVFKSTDGGATWRKVLYVSDKAGGCDLCIDPKSPDTLYASTWEAWRTPFTLNSGGPGSRLWKSTDGGETWSDLSRNPGLPAGVLGKIGVSVSPVDSTRVYALVEAQDGGLFRSDDSGATWKLTSDDREYRQRAWYYTRVVADPLEKDTVYVLNVGMYRSKDGGFKFTGVNARHGDTHDLWIDPQDNKRMVQSNDGGATVTVDGRSWSEQDIPTAQFYHVATDNAFPYRIYGAQQDNSTVRIASRTGGRGIGPSDWTSTAGGESGYVTPKPDEPDVVFGGSYGGELGMLDHRTGIYRDVSPWPDNPMGHAAVDLKYRFQWTFPIVFSPHDPDTLYTCSQVVHRTRNGGASWDEISPDLTRNDPKTLQSSGGPITQDNTSVEYYGTVFTVAESPKQKGLIWAGSDDGLVHVTRNAGGSWTAVTPKDMPHWGLCSMVDPSPHAAGRAYLAVDNHENDDKRPYVFVTEDFGKTWKNKVTGLPQDSFVRVVREDPEMAGLLYCGTETGVWVSFDNGGAWRPLQSNLPVCPVHDLTVKDDDIVVATHGRSFWVLDNIESLRQAAVAVREGAKPVTRPWLFRPKDAYRQRFSMGGGGRTDPTAEVGANPMSGIVVDYFLPEEAKKVGLKVLDESGTQVGSLASAEASKGFHRVSVRSLSYPGPRSAPSMVLWTGGGGSIAAPSGLYRVVLDVDGSVTEQPLRMVPNPAGQTTEADTVEQFKLAKKIAGRITEANDLVMKVRSVRKAVQEAVQAKPELGSLGTALDRKMTPIEEAVYQTKSQSGQDPLNYPIRLNDKLSGVFGTVNGGEFRPTRQAVQVFEALSAQLQVQLDALAKVFATDLAAFNEKAKKLGLKEVVPTGLPPRTTTDGRTENDAAESSPKGRGGDRDGEDGGQ